MMNLATVGIMDRYWQDLVDYRYPLTVLYVSVLTLISIYGLHRYWLLWLFHRHRVHSDRIPQQFESTPRVTVQLPMYNELQVAQRAIDAACRLDYPRDRLQIQVLDDSTDESTLVARERVAWWKAQGVDIEYRHRPNRHGYKAGALAAGMVHASGEFIAIFDADFVPEPDFLHRTIHHFAAPQVGMVQTRWGHLNRDESTLTRAQAIFLDGHFVIEHAARNMSQRWINFNGTAGVWRKSAIQSAGGWHSDTLTEDLDLSYRAQLAGWRFVYLPDITCPAELPPEINAFKAQQHRWTKGSIQTARKLLPRILRANVPLRVKIEAFFHLTSPMVYLYVTLMVLLFFPAFYVNVQPFVPGTTAALVWGMTLFALGTASAGTFYVASQKAQQRGVWSTVIQLPALMGIGVGIALNNSRGVIEALLGHRSGFVRTPKYNTTAAPLCGRRRTVIPTPSVKLWMGLLELSMGGYTLWCAHLSALTKHTLLGAPFLALFAAGYLYVGFSSLRSQWRVRHVLAAPALQVS